MATPLRQCTLSDLAYCLFERPVHPELFEIQSSRRFFQGDYEASIWVTGLSHVVSVFFKDDCLTEVICPDNQLLPQRGLVERFGFRGEKTHAHDWSAGLRYMMNCQVEPMSENLFARMEQDMKAMGKKRGMLVTHPERGKDNLTPLSYIDYEARVEELQVHTFHLLPEQGMALKTQSLFVLRPGE